MNIVDKRKYETFPAPPSTSHEIWCYDGDAWKIACAMAGKYDAHQYNTYRALHFAMQDDELYRRTLVETLDILQNSTNIRSRAAFIYSQLAGAISSTPIS